MGRRTIRGNIGSFFGNAFGGVRGRQNAAAWVVACTAAYFLWIKPERDAQREEEGTRTPLDDVKGQRLEPYYEGKQIYIVTYRKQDLWLIPRKEASLLGNRRYLPVIARPTILSIGLKVENEQAIKEAFEDGNDQIVTSLS